LAMGLVGLVVGLSIGITVSCAGLISFEALLVALACWAVYVSYHCMFRGVSSSSDIPGYIIGTLASWAVVCGLIGVVRLSWHWDLGAVNTTALLSAGGLLLGVVSYSYACVLLQEDERKHHLGLQRPDGAVVEQRHRPMCLQDLWRFFVWIVTWQWFEDASALPATADEEESIPAGEAIIVHNETLKLIKVCLYAPDDLICWVPYGGISGRYVCFVHAMGSKTFDLRGARSRGGVLQMKVFQPGVFDRELACLARAERGQVLTFSDVEGMVRRSRSLSSAPAPPSAPRRDPCVTDDSEDDCGRALSALGGLLPRSAATEALAQGGAGGGLLRRCGSSGFLPTAPTEVAEGAGMCSNRASQGADVRKAAPDEIVVRNRSNQDISIMLFNSNDYCFLVPLHGGCTPPREAHRFKPQGSPAREFTLKVYSVGPGAKELTYLTVSRGSTYMFCDSLLS